MNNWIHILILSVVILQGKAQNFTSNERYFLTEMVFNPAAAGSNEDLTAILSTKKTWSGTAESPRMSMINVHMKGSDLSANPRDFIGDRFSRLGFGVGIYNDRNGPLNITSVQIPLSYHLPLSKSHILSFGLAPKFYQTVLNEQEFLPIDPGDPHLSQNRQKNIFFNLNTGLYLRSNKLRIGFSTTNLVPLSANIQNFYKLENIRTWYFTCRYNFKISENYCLEPYLLLRSHLKEQRADILLTQHLGKHLAFGFGVATKMGYAFLCSVQSGSYSIGYLFEFEQSPLYKYSRGNHMIFIGKSIW